MPTRQQPQPIQQEHRMSNPTQAILGPTFEEMLHPDKIDPATRAKAVKALKDDPLNPINLYNITWRGADNQIKYEVLPKELTGVEAPIVVLYGRDFPTGAHKVGAAYSVLAEKIVFGDVDVPKNAVVWPSTGNYGMEPRSHRGRTDLHAHAGGTRPRHDGRGEMIESFGA